MADRATPRTEERPLPASPKPRRALRAWALGTALLVFAATLALFGPAAGYDFVRLDDYLYVADNPDVLEGVTWSGVKAAFSQWQQCLWIPVLNLSYMLDAECFGPGPRGFHSANVVLHALCAALWFALLRRWSGRTGFALWGALFWAWHPLRVESVAWISGRKDVLSGVFLLLCLGAYVRSRSAPRPARGWLWIAVGFFTLGLMAKSTLMAAPFLLLLLDIWPLKRVAPEGTALLAQAPALLKEKWAFVLLAALSGVLAVWGHATGAALRTVDGWTRLGRIPVHAVHYLGQTVWPRNLHVLYDDLPMGLGRVAFSICVFCGISAVAWRWRRRRPWFAIGWLWYLAVLFPVMGVVGFGVQSRADRYTYLPAMGLVLALAQIVPAGRRWRLAGCAAGIVSVLAAGAATMRQLPVWSHTGTLMGRVLKGDPFHFQANVTRGIWLWETGDSDAAQAAFRRAWAQPNPVRAEALANEAYNMTLRGRSDLALAMLEPALAGPAATALVHRNYGMASLHAGNASAAIRHLTEALAQDPNVPGGRVELIRAYFENGEAERAREQAAQLAAWPDGEIRTAADLFPFYVERWQKGAEHYVWPYFRGLAEQAPDDAALLNNVAWLAATARRPPADAVTRALAWAQRAVELTRGENAVMLDTLAAAHAAAGDFPAALDVARAALSKAERTGQADLVGGIRARMRGYASRAKTASQAPPRPSAGLEQAGDRIESP